MIPVDKRSQCTSLWLLFICIVLARADSVVAESINTELVNKASKILQKRCVRCHGGVKRAGGFSLVFRADALSEADSGRKVIVPGEPHHSELIRRITTKNEDQQMPPGELSLDTGEIDTLKHWIKNGAVYQTHWAYVGVRRPPLSTIRDTSWPNCEIDQFVLARLETEKQRPSLRAQLTALIRRVTLDLIGLPPTPDEVDRFLADKNPGAYERVVDRLLASPHFGERWASMWLDLARYADTQGFESDRYREIWRYRDWVIDALNRDLPFDQFTIEQLAGDLLPNSSTDQLIATAFHRNTLTNIEAGSDDEQFRMAAVIDRVNTTWEVWTATTFACVQCHNHPYDPFTQKEYYQCMAFFNNTEDSDKSDDRPRLDTPTASQLRHLQALKTNLANEQVVQATLTGSERSAAETRISALNKQIGAFKGATTPILRELASADQRTTHWLIRGDWLNPGEAVSPGVPAALPPLATDTPPNRLGFARWLVDSRNPLTARVAVNRFWENLFGVGLVETLEDFGTPAQRPSHPNLLDHLAFSFRHDYRWSSKKLLKTIVLSATYCQTSKQSESTSQNSLFDRGPRFRLTAEQVRDQALAISGLLSNKMHGPPVFPPRPTEVRSTFGEDKWKPSPGEDRYRRALYTFTWRTSPYPSSMTFDAPSREFCVPRRIRTNTPLQALVLLNDPVFLESAQALAVRMVKNSENNLAAQLAHGFRLVLTRQPTVDELTSLEKMFRDASHRLTAKQTPTHVPRVNAMTVVAHVLLNLDETVTKN